MSADVAVRAGLIAEAVTGCPGVARLVRGPSGTYLPGRIVPGVVLGNGTVRVSIIARYGPSLMDVAGQVRTAVRTVVQDQRVDVMIEDIGLPAGVAERSPRSSGRNQEEHRRADTAAWCGGGRLSGGRSAEGGV